MRFLIVGAGITGCTAARLLAEAGHQVHVIEKEKDPGGLCADVLKPDYMQKYGPHIFHTDSEEVWSFLSKFTGWKRFEHRVLACHHDEFYEMPINRTTAEKFFGESFLSDSDMKSFLEGKKISTGRRNAREELLSRIGEELTDAFFAGYTQKHWGVPLDQLDPEVTRRVPIRFNRDGRYFTEKYQGVPSYGYTEMCREMLDHFNITVEYETEYEARWGTEVIYTGTVNDFIDDPLPYRYIEFRYAHQEGKLPSAVVNYEDVETQFTRMTDCFQFMGHNHGITVAEFPGEEGVPCYPVMTKENRRRADEEISKRQKVWNMTFAGRTGKYMYYDIDDCVLDAMEMCRKWL